MKILHTADWHLGKIVNSVHMTEDQSYILDQIISIAKEEKPDVIVIAGDLYDRSIPPKEAVELLNNVLTSLIAELRIPVLAISGNHDSPDRLEFGNQLFKAQQLYIETKLKGDLKPVTIHDEHGPVHFHLIPYIEPADARSFFEDDNIQSHQSAMKAIINHIEKHNDMTERHVFVGHAFIAGGMESESEERLSMIGGSPYVDANLFRVFRYVALGHLHQPQRVTSDVIRYSGSILKYSFSESTHNKSVTLVDMDQHGTCTLSFVPLVPKRDMRVIESYFDELMSGEALESTEDYLHIRLLDDGQLIDPMGKLRKRYPNILRLERKVLTSKMQLNDLNRIRQKQQMTHLQLFESFYEEMKGATIPEERQGQMAKIVQSLVEQEREK
ncbi:exonuclease SbcCD subunit D [Aquibacillus koreensis]|uniref:Nuclease SbcCD subunit D n=1 Tax=Aquibacillus koreensis TaxID=279446 RepID=A0A9X4ALV1_9BACI|nr:exonuclease SbcCD subunit D [Aquibacillus koreensis]MCT2535048.1 exonuclease SbcCD subunit D [Aquibacillus koreensis]MDC3422830.1 exonuclease SbcCD subunit D [Aquibacillus koreensis]